MNIRIVATTSLTIFIIVLAWYLASTEPPAPEPMITTLTSFDPESIQNIRITRTDKDSIVLAKTAAGWEMTSPVQIRANPFRINSILAIAIASALRLADMDESALSLLGLAPASVTLALDKHLFAFGLTEPINNGRYVMYGDTVFIVADHLYQQLLQDPGFFISTRLLNTDSRLMQINYPGFELHYRDNVWVPVGSDIKLTPDELIKLTTAWTNLEATRVTTSGSSTDPADIMLVTEAGDQIALTVAATSSGLILSRNDTGLDYWFNPDIAAQLLIALIQED